MADTTISTLQNHHPSFVKENYSFFTLPAELRLKIYGFLLGPDKSEESVTSARINADGKLKARERSGQLLRTSKQIYEEAHPILYPWDTYRAPSLALLGSGLRLLGTKVQTHIKYVILSLPSLPLADSSTVNTQQEMSALEHIPSSMVCLPPTPLLRTVVLNCSLEWIAKSDTVEQPPHEAFLQRLDGSEAVPGHELYDIMKMFNSSKQVSWCLRLVTRQYSHWTKSPMRKAYSFVKKHKIKVKVRTETSQEGIREVKR
jgi:hypothetical protein